jgi:hypothetical protein
MSGATTVRPTLERPTTGAGAPLPRGVLERVPTPPALRKKKLTSRFRFYANLTTDATGDFLLPREN